MLKLQPYMIIEITKRNPDPFRHIAFGGGSGGPGPFTMIKGFVPSKDFAFEEEGFAQFYTALEGPNEFNIKMISLSSVEEIEFKFIPVENGKENDPS